MRYKAILKGKEVVPSEDTEEWAKWFGKAENRVIDKTRVGDAEVSTVFLAINHGFTGNRELWFETMVFGGPHDGQQDRYETYDQAVAGHKEVVASLGEKH